MACAALACRSEKPRRSPSPAAPSASVAPLPSLPSSAASGTNSEEDTEIQPVYPVNGKESRPLALEFCKARVQLPATRRATCCKQPPGFDVGIACAHTLSYALSTQAITLEPSSVDRCKIATEKALTGCGWVGSSPARAAPECSGLLKGTLASGARCRSSLECQKGLFCHGLTATRPGVCGEPRGTGQSCGGGVDTLASYTLETDYEATHPECQGYCLRGTCQAFKKPGESCETPLQCGPNRNCLASKCSTLPLPSEGKACAHQQCKSGARCIEGTCRAPKAEGETCRSELECQGGCVKAKGAASGRCGMACEVPDALKALQRAPSGQKSTR
jgi:hypothetical protein